MSVNSAIIRKYILYLKYQAVEIIFLKGRNSFYFMNGFSRFNRINSEVGNGYHSIDGGIIMKKTGICILTAAAVWVGAAVSVLAAGLGNGRNYADRDGDGICDNLGTAGRYIDGESGAASCYTDGESGTASCYIDDNYAGNVGEDGMPGTGGNYVDEDGDGVCDNYAGQSGGRGNGFGRGRRR